MALSNGALQMSGSVKVSGNIAPQGTAGTSTVSSPSANAKGGKTFALAFGTASGKGDIFCSGDFQLAASASLTLDIFTGSDFKDIFAGTAPFRKLKAVYAQVVSGGDSAGVSIGGAASNAHALFFGDTSDIWKIFPNGAPMLGGSPAGVTVDATHKNVKLLNNGAATVVVRLMLGGSSA